MIHLEIATLPLLTLLYRVVLNIYRTHANSPRSAYSIFHILSVVLFKKSVYSRGRFIYLTWWPVDQQAVKEENASSLLPKVKEIWDIYPENQEPVELEDISDLDELDNNEILIEKIPKIYRIF